MPSDRVREIEATVVRHYVLLDRLLAERQITVRCYDIGCAAVMDWEAQELEKIPGICASPGTGGHDDS